MKLSLLTLCLTAVFLAGCTGTTGTTVYKNGQPALQTSADMRVVRLGADGSFSAESINHSKPIAARWSGATGLVRGAGAAVGEGGSAFVKGGLK